MSNGKKTNKLPKKSVSLRITPISHGTVLDHLTPGSAIQILDIIESGKETISLATNINSTKMGKKDLIYIEGRELTKEETEKVGLFASGATLNIVEGKIIKTKSKIEVPEEIQGLLKCQNTNCITNHEPVETIFRISKNPFRAKCWHCEKEFDESLLKEMLT